MVLMLLMHKAATRQEQLVDDFNWLNDVLDGTSRKCHGSDVEMGIRVLDIRHLDWDEQKCFRLNYSTVDEAIAKSRMHLNKDDCMRIIRRGNGCQLQAVRSAIIAS